MATRKAFTYDVKSHFLIEHFSVILNHMFPVEYIYSNWFQWIAQEEANRSDPNYVGCWSNAVIETGSRAEGFCIPTCYVPTTNGDIFHFPDELDKIDHWEPDLDIMTEYDCFVRCKQFGESSKSYDTSGDRSRKYNGKEEGKDKDRNKDRRDVDNGRVKDKNENKDEDRDEEKSQNQDTDDDIAVPTNVDEHKTTVDKIPIFSVSHIEQDPRYLKLLLTPDYKISCPKYSNQEFLPNSFLFPNKDIDFVTLCNAGRQGTGNAHGPVRKYEMTSNIPKYEQDVTNVFKYPQPWPEVAMDWFVRPRSGHWPSPELLHDILESSCHIAPVGCCKQDHYPDDVINASHTESSSPSPKNEVTDICLNTAHVESNPNAMNETEWRLSFSVAENKLGQSVTPLQRHIIVLLKMLKKSYFPEIVSSYHLKNLLFWEIEKKDESFWNEDQLAKCLVYMLDRLDECLQHGVLPHYIIPQSNLLEGEDREVLTKAAGEIRDLRLNIVEKTFRMFKRVLATLFQSRAFQRGLRLEPFIEKLQNISYLEDKNKDEDKDKCREKDRPKRKDKGKDSYKDKGKDSYKDKGKDSYKDKGKDSCKDKGKDSYKDKDMHKLFFSLYRAFILQYQQCLDELNVIRCDATIEREVDISINVYQSLLARTLIKLWLATATHSHDASHNRDDILTFIRQEIPHEYINAEFLKISMNYVTHAQKGRDLSLVVPQVSEKSKDIYRKIAQDNFNELKSSTLRLQTIFQTADIQGLVEILQELGMTDIDPETIEYVKTTKN